MLPPRSSEITYGEAFVVESRGFFAQAAPTPNIHPFNFHFSHLCVVVHSG